MSGFITLIVLLLIGFFFGRMAEQKHFAQLARDEDALSHIERCNLKTVPAGFVPGGVLVTGNVVIAVDYFKVFVTAIRQIFGGRLGAYESLMERARREALVRMLRQAADMGADAVYNVRYEFSAVGNQPAQKGGGVELLAYGTALKRA